jgi:hypothetical protein
VEQEIAQLVIERLLQGAEDYGDWPLDAPRDNLEEALEELIDTLHYAAAEVGRLRHHKERPGGRARMLRVYTCHRFSSDQAGAAKALRRICREIVEEGALPIAPQLLLPQFLSEDTERDLAMRLCQEMLRECDEVRVFGRELTPGMRIEISFAELLGIPVRFMDSSAEIS